MDGLATQAFLRTWDIQSDYSKQAIVQLFVNSDLLFVPFLETL